MEHPYWYREVKEVRPEHIDPTFCKQLLKDKVASSYETTVYRQCRLKPVEDGLCKLHNPQFILEALETEATSETLNELRNIQRMEEKLVGTYLRKVDPKLFEAVLREIKDPRKMIDLLRRIV